MTRATPALPAVVLALAAAGCGSSSKTPGQSHVTGPPQPRLTAVLEAGRGSFHDAPRNELVSPNSTFSHRYRARPGALVDLRMRVFNGSSVELSDVRAALRLPPGMSVVLGSERVRQVTTDGALGQPLASLTQGGVNIGPLPADGAVDVEVTTQIVAHPPPGPLTARGSVTSTSDQASDTVSIRLG